MGGSSSRNAARSCSHGLSDSVQGPQSRGAHGQGHRAAAWALGALPESRLGEGREHAAREENVVLKDYLNNLMGKVGKMPKLGTSAPSRAMVAQNPLGAQTVKV